MQKIGRTTTGKTAGDVCVYGLQIILPLMTIDLLKLPALCSQYYKVFCIYLFLF